MPPKVRDSLCFPARDRALELTAAGKAQKLGASTTQQTRKQLPQNQQQWNPSRGGKTFLINHNHPEVLSEF
jgi:hypothetical protein